MVKSDFIILAGGRSSRMGEDKGLLKINGSPLVVKMLKKVSQPFGKIWIVCSSLEQQDQYQKQIEQYQRSLPCQDIEVIVDRSDNDRAASYGIRAGMEATQAECAVVCTVDAAGVDSLLLKKLLKAAEHSMGSPCAFTSIENQLFPFPALLWKENLSQLPTAPTSIRGLLQSFDNLERVEADDVEEDLLNVNLNSPAEVDAFYGKPLLDPMNRRINYLRLSLTEVCNMRCDYCVSDEYAGHVDLKERLADESIDVVLESFRRMGFEKIRFTGGEPFLHPHLLQTIKKARRLGYETISITTNASVAKDIKPYIAAGLTHINISLDSLDEDNFYSITKSKQFKAVMRQIEDSVAEGLNVKNQYGCLERQKLFRA